MIRGFIFDLDGVIVDSAKYHFLAWQRMAQALGISFDEKDNEKLKGVSRAESLELILEWGGQTLTDEEKQRWMTQKNDWYLEYIQGMKPSELLPGAAEFIASARRQGIRIALGSASKNAQFILRQTGLTELFDHIVDGTVVTVSKPEPDVFLEGAQGLNLPPEQCLVFEDAEAGVEAARRGRMKVVGIGTHLPADITAENLGQLPSPTELIHQLDN